MNKPNTLYEASLIDNYRIDCQSDNPEILADIYREDCNLSVWRRSITSAMQLDIANFIKSGAKLNLVRQVSPNSVTQTLLPYLDELNCAFELCEDISQLVDMFCCLFDLQQAGLRLSILNKAMCPKFHVDKVPCRLITTYSGCATQWLANHSIDRQHLARPAEILNSETARFYNPEHVCELKPGEVALLKGETWPNNENAGLIHRSPALKSGEKRLMLTLDLMH